MKSKIRNLRQNLAYILKIKGRCSFLGDVTEDECTKIATRFELWEGGDFSISCRQHHREPLKRGN